MSDVATTLRQAWFDGWKAGREHMEASRLAQDVGMRLEGDKLLIPAPLPHTPNPFPDDDGT